MDETSMIFFSEIIFSKNHFNKKNKRNKLGYRISWYYSIKLIKPEILEEEESLDLTLIINTTLLDNLDKCLNIF